MDVHRASSEKRERAAPVSKSVGGVECQPNAAAPLLRDEKSRREWIEHELDMCCQVTTGSPTGWSTGPQQCWITPQVLWGAMHAMT